MMPFAFMIGKCLWGPPSAKAALAFIVYFYGLNPEFGTIEYETVIQQQMIAAGATADEAKAKMEWLDKCMLDAYSSSGK
jgi:hypothetical protein